MKLLKSMEKSEGSFKDRSERSLKIAQKLFEDSTLTKYQYLYQH